MLTSIILVALVQQPAQVPGTAEPRPLGGLVIDAEGQPVANIEVWLTSGSFPSGERPLIGGDQFRMNARTPATERHPVLGRSWTDAEGRFRLELPADVVRSQEPTPVALWACRPGGRVAFQRVPWTTPAPAEPIRLVLEPPAASRFRLLGPDGEPDSGARLIVTALAHLAVPEELADRVSVVIGPDGGAVVAAFAPREIRGIRIESSRFGKQQVTIPESAAAQVRSLTLEPVGRVSGRVRTDDGKPVPGLAILARSMPEGLDLGGTLGLAESTTDDSGRFAIPAIAAGRLALTLDFLSRPDLPYRGQAPANRVVEAGQTTTLEIALKPSVRLRGVVRERGTEVPIPGVRPVIPDPDARFGGSGTVVTDAEGKFVGYMEGDQPYAFIYATPRPYFVPADAPDSLQLLPARATEFTLAPIELVRGVGLRGTLVDEAGSPVGGALVRASWDGTDTILQSVAVRTNPRGAFLLDGLDPLADLRLTAQSRDASTAKPETVRAGSDQPVEFRLIRARSVALAGRVLDAAGKPVEGAEVRIRSRTRNPIGQIWRIDPIAFDDRDALRTDAEGRFRTPQRVPRDVEYEAAVRAPGMLPGQAGWLKPGDGETTPFADVTLRRLRAVEGLVRDRHGKPIAGATVLQSGDGPMRTRATTDEEGRFRVPGVIEGKGLLFVQKEGFRFHGQPIDTDVGAAVLVLIRTDEPPIVTLKTLAGVLPREEELALARRLLEPYVEKALAKSNHPSTYEVLTTLADIEPGRVLELVEKMPDQPHSIKDDLRHLVAIRIAQDDPEEALSVAQSLQDSGIRAWCLSGIFDALPESARARKVEVLAQAQLQARSLKEPGTKLGLLGWIANRWFDLGETDRARSLLREGRSLAKEVAPPGYFRALFAEALARDDLPAALALLDTARDDARRGDRVNRQFIFDRSHGEIAYRLASRDPAGAERVLALIFDSYRRCGYVAAACSRMASRDLPRALKLAESIDDPLQQAYAFGLMARDQAPIDKASAARLLDEAFARLEEHRDTQRSRSFAACVAAVLLPVVEQVDPTRVQEFVWRAVSLRAPSPADHGEGSAGRANAELAMNLARYDRTAASAVLEPSLAGFGSTDADSDRPAFIAMAKALIDPHRAVALIEGLPDDLSLARHLPKNTARLMVAEMLGKHGDARWKMARERGVALLRPEGSDL